MKEIIIKKCNTCGKVIRIINEGSPETICCGDPMMIKKANSVDAAVEKHVPEYEIKDGKVYVTVNHVMEEDHYIEWISIVNEEEEHIKKLKPGQVAKAVFPYIENATIYEYCNKHGLWKKEIN